MLKKYFKGVSLFKVATSVFDSMNLAIVIKRNKRVFLFQKQHWMLVRYFLRHIHRRNLNNSSKLLARQAYSS